MYGGTIMEKIKLALLGCGQRGAGMGKLIAEFPDVEVASVCDVYPDCCAHDSIRGYTGTCINNSFSLR